MLRAAAAALLCAFTLSVAAQNINNTRLITRTNQISGITLNANNIDPAGQDAEHSFFAPNQPFTVTLDNPLKLSDTEGLILYLGHYWVYGAPTLLKVEGKPRNEGNFITLGYAHVLYRGGDNTHEFSDPIYEPTGVERTYDQLRFTVLKVEAGTRVEIFKFNVYPYKKGDLNPAGRLDTYRLPTDYYKSMWDYTYEPNSGILDKRNHYGVNADYPEDKPWGEENTFVYDGEVHELPTFDKQGGGQMPHVTEHTLYAMPGDMISLSPYYDLPTSGNYREKFSHWYGYIPRNSKDELQEQDYHHIKDSRGNRLLDFLIDPAAIVLTEKAGYFAGTSFPRPIGKYVIRTVDDLREFSSLVAQGNGYQNLDAILAADIDCGGASVEIGGWNGTEYIKYGGTFNGNGHSISNVKIAKNESSYNDGFFGWLGQGACVTNLNLINVNVSSGGRAGALAGTVDGRVTISNCYVEGDVLISSTADVEKNNISYAGGLVGIATKGAEVNLENTVFTGTVMGGYRLDGSNGALIGYIENDATATVKNCYADATVSNVQGENGMFSSFNPVSVEKSYMNVLIAEKVPVIGSGYNLYQAGFANVYGADEEAFHSEPDVPQRSHVVRVYGIPDDPNLWPAVYMNFWKKDVIDTGWPGIRLTKGDGYYYATVPECDYVDLMVNNGNNSDNSNPHDYLMGSSPCFSSNGDGCPAPLNINFSATGGNYNITFTGHRSSLEVSSLSGASTSQKIYVKENPEKWNNYMLVLHNAQGKTYTKIGTDGKETRDGEQFGVFNIPADFNRTGLKYSVVPFTGAFASSPLAKAVANPMPTQATGTHRIYLKKVESWSQCFIGLWGESVPYAWYNNLSGGNIKFDGVEYCYYDLPANYGTWGGINIAASMGEANVYKDAIVNFDGDMKVELTNVSSNGSTSNCKVKGGYYNPIYFEYQEGQPAPQLTVDGTTYTAGTVEVGGKKYYYINFAPTHTDSHDRFSTNPEEDRSNPKIISRSEMVDLSKVWTSAGIEYPAQFYSALPLDGDPTIYLDARDVNEVARRGLGWTAEINGVPAPPQTTAEVTEETTLDAGKFLTHNDLRWYGTEATFFQPIKTDKAPDSDDNLKLEKPEYHIAADFGHEFAADGDDYNIDHVSKTIHEPIINFRHIFHIKDGKTLADNATTSKEDNENYLRANSRAVSARAGYDFQIRLSTEVPRYEGTDTYSYTRANFYYKKAEGLYERVPRVGLEIRDQSGNLVADQGMFFFDAYTTTQGTRKFPDGSNGFAVRNADNGASYHGGNGGGSVFRSLFCPSGKAKVGTYVVRLKALNADGSDIKIIGTNDNLYIDEYIVTFLDGQSASVVTEAALATEDYRTHRAEYLEQEEICGAPAVVVDFDQYRTFETEPYNPDDYFSYHSENKKFKAYKWPVLWNKSTYSFGYGGYYNYDFNEYIIANHSSQVMYHAAANNHKNDDGSTGLYDRLWYDTKGEQSGYFYYTNAASDPGVAARLYINNLCPGSTVAVSAWVTEMSYENEVANLSFNFVAVDENNNREIVHSFVTGYIDNLNYGSQNARYVQTNKTPTASAMQNHGDWMHVYYSFIPDLSSIQNLSSIHHYELELENNCVSSIGADYAVDDIRAYIISPQLTARQLEPVCDANQQTVGICVSSRFDKLLDSNGLVESTGSNGVGEEKMSLHFMVLDKNKYDRLYAAAIEAGNDLTSDAKKEMVEQSAIVFNETTDDAVDKTYITAVEISNNFSHLTPYAERTYGQAMGYTSSTSGTRYVRTNILPYDADLRPGKDYYIVLYAQYKDLPVPGIADFAITDDPCAKYAVITLQGSGIIKVDGIAYTDGEPIDVCAGQSPVVQVDLKMIESGTGTEHTTYSDYVNAPTHYYDWYNGPIEDFMAKEGDAPSYYDLLYIFRNGDESKGLGPNTDAPELPDPAEGASDIYAPLRGLIAEGKLVLHASSFVFPPLKANSGEDNIVVLTAMPIIPGPDDENGYKVCSQPNEIRLRVENNAPVMFDGFSGIEYPVSDVPLRLGLRQLGSVNGVAPLTSKKETSLGVDATVAIPADARYLEIPLRAVTSYKGADASATMTMAGNRNNEADPYVYLAETNDPHYIGLDKHPMDDVVIKNSLLPIGMVKDLTASTGNQESNVTIVFSEQMQFREGYYYRVRFAYDEALNTEVEGYCEGHVVFTLKVVPEYMKWTGADSRNWNNDANWSRVVADELLLAAGDGKINNHTIVDSKRTALVENGQGVIEVKVKEVLGNTSAYAPLDFTKVIVPDLSKEYVDASATEPVMKPTEGYPYMFSASQQSIATLNGSRDWNDQAEIDEAGEATKYIEFDMASLDMESKLACRPWYANTCEQIHFNHGGELAHQEHFIFGKNYQKAWVDVEMTGDRWYTLGSPLQGVVAGDMYTKTNGGKQDNELFTDISFNNTDYGRYAPAVYQRGWNKAEAKTYMLGDGTHASKSAAVALNWSRVYNDVDESYTPGTGFSIRTATKGINNAADDKVVRFRLPKADNTYSYFDSSANTENADDTNVSRNGNRHSLTAFTDGVFTTTASVGTDGYYFLAGNPFMASMDMAEFLRENSSVIEPYYWIMTDDRQSAILWDEKSGTFISTEDADYKDASIQTPSTVAPMQGFFVKAKTQGKNIGLKFTPDMICNDNMADKAGNPLLRTRGNLNPQLITISVTDDSDAVTSSAVISLDPEADNDYAGAEDAELLQDATLEKRTTVYTVASGRALAINSLSSIEETEIGVVAAEGVRSTLLFEGIEESEGLILTDTATGEMKGLYNGMTVAVTGAVSGRFFITRSSEGVADVPMAVVMNNQTVSVVSPNDGITARAYSTDGLIVGEWSSNDTSLQFDLNPGIYIIEAVSEKHRVTKKFVVK